MNTGKVLGVVAIVATALLGTACGTQEIRTTADTNAANVSELQVQVATLQRQLDAMDATNATQDSDMAGMSERIEILRIRADMADNIDQDIVAALCDVDELRDYNDAWITLLKWRLDTLENMPTQEPSDELLTTYQGVCVQREDGSFYSLKPEYWGVDSRATQP